MESRRLPISAFLRKSEDWVYPEPDQIYQQIRVRLWGKGLTLRAKVAGANIASRRQLRASAGQFLISRIDARHGAFGIVPDHLAGALVSSDFPCFDINERVVLPRYLEWYTRTESFAELCRRSSAGSTNRIRLKESQFMAMEIALPPPDQQRKTVIELDRISMMISDAIAKTDEIKREIAALVECIHFDIAELAEQRLADFIELWEDRTRVEATLRYPQIGVRSLSRGLFFKESVLGSETRYGSFNRLHRGMFVVSQPKGWEGAIAICGTVHEGWYVSPEYRTFRCKPGILDEQYLGALSTTRWFQDELTKLTRGQGARRQRVRPDMLLNMTVRMPSIAQQRRLLETFENLNLLQHTRDHTVSCIRALQSSILQGAFCDHIAVRPKTENDPADVRRS